MWLFCKGATKDEGSIPGCLSSRCLKQDYIPIESLKLRTNHVISTTSAQALVSHNFYFRTSDQCKKIVFVYTVSLSEFKVDFFFGNTKLKTTSLGEAKKVATKTRSLDAEGHWSTWQTRIPPPQCLLFYHKFLLVCSHQQRSAH